MQRPISRLAIVNRGEPAMRLIHAVRELNVQRPEPIRLIALFTESESGAMFVRHADEAVCVTPAASPGGAGTPPIGYLDLDALQRALRAARADAAWVGWGFVAEQPEFAELCERLGIVFVGPGSSVMRRLGDKISAKRLAEEAGVPVAAWSGGPVATAEDAVQQARRIGLPLMIKASAGGGGRGIRRVDSLEAIPGAFHSARAEALTAFGDGTLLLEKLITGARHIEVQVIADDHGTVWPVGVRDCSYQRRNQKVLEESASPALTSAQEREVADAARRLAVRAGYRNAGTVEFLYEPATRRFSFMEVNARLQVEHPVTEAVTGLDLVKLQLLVAAGGRLKGSPPRPSGHAIEARLNAEDPELGFAPAPGRVTFLRLPTGPGVRVDTGVAEGDVIPEQFDSMIGKLIAWGANRSEALARLRRAVEDTVAIVDGGTTNQGFLLELLDHPQVRAGDVDTTWLDRIAPRRSAPTRQAQVAVLQAAIELADQDIATDRARFYAYARRGRPQATEKRERGYQLRHRGHSYRASVAQTAPRRYRVRVDGYPVTVTVTSLGAHERRTECNEQVHRILVSHQGGDFVVAVDGVPHRVSPDDGGIVRNPSPALVVSLPAAVGDVVREGDVVAVVEAMKMESSLTAPFRGRIRRIFVSENTHVTAQEPLLALEPLDPRPTGAAEARLSFDLGEVRAPPGSPQRRAENTQTLQWLMLGFDVAPDDAERALAELHEPPGALADEPALTAAEHHLLEMFADLRGLSRPHHADDEPGADLLSPQEHLLAWFRSLDAEAEGLPSRFVAQLRAALSHYGITSLDRTPALELASYRLFLAQQHAEASRAAVLAILDRHLERTDEPAGRLDQNFREVLDRLVVALEGRDPVIVDLARELRFLHFDEPAIRQIRDRIYAEMEQHVDALLADPERSDRAERVAAIVACPRPLAPRLTAAMSTASPAARRTIIEAMARRYYRPRSLGSFAQVREDGYEFATAGYRHGGRPRRLFATHVELDEVGAAARAFARRAATLPRAELAVLDLYAEHRGAAPAHADLAAQLSQAMAGIPVVHALHRIVVAVAEPRRGRGMAAIDLFTFRPGPDGLREDTLLRGLHPLMGERLKLWRLREFDLCRLPSAEDIYAFHGIARDNPKDERLFALAEVRDLTPVLDDGQVTALPELEQVLMRVLETIRGFQARRPLQRRPMWNRVLLHAWPIIELAPEQIRPLVERVAASTAGLGLEMVVVQGQMREADGTVRDRMLRFFAPVGHSVVFEIDAPPTQPLAPLDEGARRVVAARRRGTLHPAEIVRMLAPAHPAPGQPAGSFIEHELDAGGRLVPVDRPAARNP
ncbi:MAG TPA: biotin carboxylase N-terminal domain-containing protein, partial [Solirubrobacteraceae bacterium]|nr:biotin carboxylase N-terminal domain-containing protein [Solirubrobacteraceae bacterium]